MPENTSPTRSLRLGVAGPVGTGKSSLIALLCRELSSDLSLGVITNDIYTDEDARFLRSAGVLDPDRIRAVETGACPHTAIRDDVTANLLAVEDLEEDFAPLDVVLVESGGDNLTATFSPALVDAQIFVLDVAGGGDVARKGGPGIARADLLVVNKTDLAPYVGVDVERMVADGEAAREGRPVLALSRENPTSVAELCGWVRGVLAEHTGGRLVPADPGPMAPHFHADEDGGGFFHSHDDPDAAPGAPGAVVVPGAVEAAAEVSTGAGEVPAGAPEVAGTPAGSAFVHRHDGAGAHRHADGAHPVEHVHHETYLGEELAPTAGGPGGLRGAARG